MKNLFLSLSFLFCFVSLSKAQASNNYPQNYFRSPVDIPLFLAGNYGELRSNHFHAGIDVKTQGVEGKRIYAVAEGYVSKIKIQERGYGKLIYITHPNGYTSVYAHLREFFLPIENRVKTEQYQKQSYTVEFILLPHEFPVKKGDVIAFSGNSGGSVAPHLHFEIRETATDIPVNPLLFNFNISDKVAPNIKLIRVYPLDKNSSVNGLNKAVNFKAIKKGNSYTIAEMPKVNGNIGIGIDAIDMLSGVNNQCGVYSIDMQCNKKDLFYCKMEKISLPESKYLNAHTDFEYRKLTGNWVHRSYVLPGNHLPIYTVDKNRGVIACNSDSIYQVNFMVKDVYGNETKMDFKLQGTKNAIVPDQKVNPNFIKTFKYQLENSHNTEEFKLYIPNFCLYQDIDFEFEQLPALKALSNVYRAQNPSVPLHKEITLAIKCLVEPENPEKLVAAIKEYGSVAYATGTFINGWFNFKSRTFATYYLDEDTKSPVIKPVNILNNKNVSAQKNIVLEISDDKSGIKSYKAYLNDQWILMEYDYKKKSLTHKLDGKFVSGVNKFKLVVSDQVNNESVYECNLVF